MLNHKEELDRFISTHPNNKIIIGGSSAMVLHGYPVNNQDIDIMTDIPLTEMSEYPHIDAGSLTGSPDTSPFVYLSDPQYLTVLDGYTVFNYKGLCSFYETLIEMYHNKDSEKEAKFVMRLNMLTQCVPTRFAGS